MYRAMYVSVYKHVHASMYRCSPNVLRAHGPQRFFSEEAYTVIILVFVQPNTFGSVQRITRHQSELIEFLMKHVVCGVGHLLTLIIH